MFESHATHTYTIPALWSDNLLWFVLAVATSLGQKWKIIDFEMHICITGGSKGSFSWCIYAAPVQDDLNHLPLDKRGLPFRRQYFQMHYQNVIDWENGLLSAQHQVIPVQSLIYFDVGFLSTRPMGMNFSEILIEMVWFSRQKMDFKMSSAKWYLFFLSLNVLNHCVFWHHDT